VQARSFHARPERLRLVWRDVSQSGSHRSVASVFVLAFRLCRVFRAKLEPASSSAIVLGNHRTRHAQSAVASKHGRCVSIRSPQSSSTHELKRCRTAQIDKRFYASKAAYKPPKGKEGVAAPRNVINLIDALRASIAAHQRERLCPHVSSTGARMIAGPVPLLNA
jgi:hypothetical protein